MTSLLFLSALGALTTLASAQGPAAVVCIPGQCLSGFSNLTMGAKITAPESPLPLLLLPGQYSTTTNPQLLHDVLTSSSKSMSSSVGFDTSQDSLPLDLALTPGLALYTTKLFGGQSAFSDVPSSPPSEASPVPLNSPGSIALADNVWATISSGSNSSAVFWESVPDIDQLPSAFSSNRESLSLLQLQSSRCSSPCTSAGICTPSGTCACQPNFTGSSCEQCSPGFFGPSCSPCPSGCDKCDEGITGSGTCLDTNQPQSPLEVCNCLNGQCGTGGSCTCNSGWTTSDNGTACAKCTDGFFLSSTGSCNVCSLGCSRCSDTTGECLACDTGFSLDANDKTKCNPPQSTDNTGAICPSGSFGSGTGPCQACDTACSTCRGPTSNDCISCAPGTYSFAGSCVQADANGVCQTGGPAMFADNNKGECDSCPAKCTSCGIPNFTRASTSNQVQCTGCLPGSVLFEGNCLDSCPSGMFFDGTTCSACDSTCSSCSGSADFCTSCPTSRLSFNGTCVDACPSGSTEDSDGNSCSACHPDCETCSGPSFSQCTSCPPSIPALSDGRCLAICNKGEYLDQSSSSCQSCASSCSSCSGPSASECLACSSPSQVLREGQCVEAPCSTDGTGSLPIAGLGVCISELVLVPEATGTIPPAALPSVTGLTTPTAPESSSGSKLEWWQILLMALGCAFIFLVFILLFRRRMRKKRKGQTRAFAQKRNLGQRWGWSSFKHGWLGLFGRARARRAQKQEDLAMQLHDFKRVSVHTARDHDEAERARPMLVDEDKVKMDIFDSYYQTAGHTAQSLHSSKRSSRHQAPLDDRITASSMYSEITGQVRNTPEPRQPIKDRRLPDNHGLLANSRLRQSLLSERSFLSSSDGSRPENPEPLIPLSQMRSPSPLLVPKPAPSPAQEYASAVKPTLTTFAPLPGDQHWLTTVELTPPESQSSQLQQQYFSSQPIAQQPTGSSNYSKKNPFRK